MTTLEGPTPRAPRACVECQASKTRCVWPEETGVGKCRRCLSSMRACTRATPGSQRRAVAKSRFGQLEEKVEDMLSLLNAARNPQGQTPSLPPPNQQHLNQTASVPPTLAMPMFNSIQSGVVPALDSIEITPGFRVTLGEADRLVHLYRTSYSSYFPFVLLSPEATACELYSARPLLFRTIMHVVAPQTYLIHCAFDRWFREYIAQHVVVAQEKTLEVLQAILLHTAWADFRFYRGTEATSLLQLAIGLVSDLGLNQPPAGPPIPAAILNELARSQRHKIKSTPTHSLEDMRSVLGCFFLSSTLSTLFRKMPQFPYTSYLATCCTELSNAQEHASDQFLVALVRLQSLACRARPVLPSVEMDGIGTVDFGSSLYMSISTLRNELESMKSKLSREIQDSSFFAIAYYGTLMRLYEPVIYTRTSSASSVAPIDAGRRTEALWHCLEATRYFYEAFVTIPVDMLGSLPFPGPAYLSCSTITINWLLCLRDSDWDVETARTSFDFPAMLDRLILRYEEAERVGILEETFRKRRFADEQKSSAIKSRDKMQWCKSWHLFKVRPASEPFIDLSQLGSFDDISAADFDPQTWEIYMNQDLGAVLEGWIE